MFFVGGASRTEEPRAKEKSEGGGGGERSVILLQPVCHERSTVYRLQRTARTAIIRRRIQDRELREPLRNELRAPREAIAKQGEP